MHSAAVLSDIAGRMVGHHLAGTTAFAGDISLNPVSVYLDAQFDLFHGVVRDEDIPCTEEMRRKLRSGANAHSVFGRNEPALQHLHRAYEEALRR